MATKDVLAVSCFLICMAFQKHSNAILPSCLFCCLAIGRPDFSKVLGEYDSICRLSVISGFHVLRSVDRRMRHGCEHLQRLATGKPCTCICMETSLHKMQRHLNIGAFQVMKMVVGVICLCSIFYGKVYPWRVYLTT